MFNTTPKPAQARKIRIICLRNFAHTFEALPLHGRTFLPFCFSLVLFSGLVGAQTPEQIARAQPIFRAYDVNGDDSLSHDEFVTGTIEHWRARDPLKARWGMLLMGKQIHMCLGLVFEASDLNQDGLISQRELVVAYAQDVFSDIREKCR